MTETDKTERLKTQDEAESKEGNEELKDEEQPTNKNRKRIIGIVTAILVVIALVCGGVYMATASGQEQSQVEPVGTVAEEADTEAHVVLEAELSELDVLTEASFTIYEKDNEKTSVLKVTNAAINEHIEINADKLKEGKTYKIYLTETPILSDGSLLVIEKAVEFTFEEKEHFDIKVKLTRIAPEKMSKIQLEETATALEALGKTELATSLRSMIETAPEESEVVSETAPEGTTTSNSSSGNTGSSNGSDVSAGSGNSGDSNNTGGASNSDPNAGKTWHEAIYETVVISEAGYRSEPRTGYQDVCYCGDVLTGAHYIHAKACADDGRNHAGFYGDQPYTYYEQVWVDAVTEQRLVRAAGWY